MIAPAAVQSTQAAVTRRKPNIIFFLVDDYDKPETSVYGGKVLTPNLERLARNGITFHNAHMSSTVCTPSRYTCLTGRYAGSSYSKVHMDQFPAGTQSLPAFNVALESDNMNVGQVLADNGYATGFVGKYHVGGEHFTFAEREERDLQPLKKNVEWTPELNKIKYNNEKAYRELIKKQGFGQPGMKISKNLPKGSL